MFALPACIPKRILNYWAKTGKQEKQIILRGGNSRFPLCGSG